MSRAFSLEIVQHILTIQTKTQNKNLEKGAWALLLRTTARTTCQRRPVAEGSSAAECGLRRPGCYCIASIVAALLRVAESKWRHHRYSRSKSCPSLNSTCMEPYCACHCLPCTTSFPTTEVGRATSTVDAAVAIVTPFLSDCVTPARIKPTEQDQVKGTGKEVSRRSSGKWRKEPSVSTMNIFWAVEE